MDNSVKENSSETKKSRSISSWIYCILACICVILFVLWTGYWAVLILIPVFIDVYITKFIPWGAWKESKNPKVKKILSWVDAIVFALVGVYIITSFFFQNYQIPSSSLEKSLLVGDFLCVNKLSYGARSPMTPFSFPLVQHTFPFINTKSYLEKPELEYKRFKGLGNVERYDIVVFNYPSGDTVATKMPDYDYYMLTKQYGRDALWNNKEIFGDIVYRPVDRRENYVKRCVGLPGDTIQLRNDTVYINNIALPSPENMQLLYCVQTDGTMIAPAVFESLGMSEEDRSKIKVGDISMVDSTIMEGLGLQPTDGKSDLLYTDVCLTNDMITKLLDKPFVKTVISRNEYAKRRGQIDGNKGTQVVYPVFYDQEVELGDYPATWIPSAGATIKFDQDVDRKVATYERCIKNYEHNDFQYRDGVVYINGKPSDSYTFKYDYYFMMGDNRDNSADSRSWGFVPEDHIVGKPMFIWMSLNKDKGLFNGKIRWDRLFTNANKNK